MSGAIDNESQKALAKECVNDIIKLKKTDKEGYRAIVDLMKKYEEKIFDQYNRKPAQIQMPVQQHRTERDMSPGLQYPFVSDATFQTNYQRLHRGYENVNPQQQFQNQPQFPPQPQLQPQLQEHPLFKDPRLQPAPNSYQSGAIFPQRENRFMGDMPKFQLPQGFDPNYNNPNAYVGRPMNDISNQQHLLNSYGGLGNSYGYQDPLNKGVQQHGDQFSFGLNLPNEKNPYLQNQFGQDNLSLSRNIEMLGGIERTLPNMQRSLSQNELRNIEQNYRPQGQSATNRLNNLIQNPYGGAPQDYQNIRAASPARDVYNQLEAQYLRGASPQAPNRFSNYLSPNKDFATEPDLRWSQYVNAKSRDPSGDRRPNSARKSGLSTSKDLRSEKEELLGLRYNILASHGERDYYN